MNRITLSSQDSFPLFLATRPIQEKVQIFTGNGKKHIIYEYIITNNSTTSININKIKITKNNCKHIKIVAGKKLEENFSTMPKIFTLLPQIPILQSGESGVIYFFLTLSHDSKYVENTFCIESDTNKSVIIPKPLIISKCNPIIISPPLKGKNWYAADGPSNDSSHRRIILTLNGDTVIPERFAIDFIQYGKKGLIKGDPSLNESYYGYRSPIFSVANGKVIGLQDGVPENIPGQTPVIPLEDSGGNYLIIQLDNYYDVLYAHIVPGTIKVNIGDYVHEGQLLGLLGNSGNSEFPHLHFQITTKLLPIGNSNKPFLLNGQGIPWHLNKFILENYIVTENHPILPIPLTIKVVDRKLIKNEIMMDKNLASFH